MNNSQEMKVKDAEIARLRGELKTLAAASNVLLHECRRLQKDGVLLAEGIMTRDAKIASLLKEKETT